MNHTLQCQCGALRGHISHTELALRGVCYCKDCRAYSYHLKTESLTHDVLGGAEFVATQSKYLSFTEGTQYLACLSLTEKGLLRWYTKCCNTPIGNTTRNWKFPYVGLISACLKADTKSFEHTFPKIQMRVNTGSANQAQPKMLFSTVVSLAGFMPRVIASGINGSYKQTPFFAAPAGSPIIPVDILSKAELARAYSAA